MNKNEYKIGTKVIKFDYDIRQTIKTTEEVLILLEIPYSENELNNVYSFNKEGDINWRVNIKYDEYGINNKLPLEMISFIDGALYASDFYGRRFKIAMKTGVSLEYDVVR